MRGGGLTLDALGHQLLGLDLLLEVAVRTALRSIPLTIHTLRYLTASCDLLLQVMGPALLYLQFPISIRLIDPFPSLSSGSSASLLTAALQKRTDIIRIPSASALPH